VVELQPLFFLHYSIKTSTKQPNYSIESQLAQTPPCWSTNTWSDMVDPVVTNNFVELTNFLHTMSEWMCTQTLNVHICQCQVASLHKPSYIGTVKTSRWVLQSQKCSTSEYNQPTKWAYV